MKLIPLTQGKQAIVDDEDYEWLSQWQWRVLSNKSNYAVRYDNKKAVLMHRALLNAPTDKFVDHRDGNGLNNTRANIRLCSHAENMRNIRTVNKAGVSRFKGVYFEPRKRLWRARIRVAGKPIGLGRYKVEEDAARAYDQAAKEYFGEFAKPNFAV